MQPAQRRSTVGVALAVALLVIIALASLGVVVWIARDRVFGLGPAAVHDLAAVTARLHVCGRDYHGGGRVRSLREIQAEGPVVLIDPAPFAPCPSPDAQGNRPCSSEAAGACATVVYVRVGEDAYVGYALAGGP